MRRIEFIGASCVGKSTLFNKVLSLRDINDNWSYPSESQLNIVKQLQDRKYGFNRRGLIMMGLWRSQHAKWVREILENYKNPALMAFADVFDGLVGLYMKHLDTDKSVSNIRKLQLLNLYYNRLVYDVILPLYYSPDALNVYDDGIIAINSGIFDVTEFKINALSENKNASIVLPVGVIYCKLSLNSNVLRMNKRVNKGQGNYAIRKMKEQEIEKNCHKGLLAAQGIFTVMDALSIPSIIVDMEKDVLFNAKQVIKFIRTFSR